MGLKQRRWMRQAYVHLAGCVVCKQVFGYEAWMMKEASKNDGQ